MIIIKPSLLLAEFGKGLPKPAECLKDFIIKAVVFSGSGSSVDIGTGYELDGQAIESRSG